MTNILFLITKYEDMHTTEEQEAYIESVELFIQECRAAANRGDELYSDAVYDNAIEILRTLRPDSPLLGTVWSEDSGEALDADLDAQLVVHPMLSIQTVKDLSCKQMLAFAERVEDLSLENGVVTLHASLKENGHGIRVVYKDGKLVKAHTRGRSSNGRDITSAMSLILPAEIPVLSDKGIVEIRGEVVLPFRNLDKARSFKPEIKSAFTGVSAMIRASATPEETKLLEFVAYALYSDAITFSALSECYKYLEELGFTVPTWGTVNFNCEGSDLVTVAGRIVEFFEQSIDSYGYFTDGVVLAIDNFALMESLGSEGSARLGNVALKVGFWQQDKYDAIVEEIVWKEGRSKLSPVAKVQPTLTANGATVTNVPLYAPVHILKLEAYPGNVLSFRFGGEAGVVPCYPDGTLVTEK